MLKIGDFSKLSRVSIRMLRHYDEINLLKPIKVDDVTGYRYYSEEQLLVMARIHVLKDMGFGLSVVREALTCYDDKEALEKVRKMYDELSPYEKTFIGQDLVKLLTDLEKKMQELVASAKAYDFKEGLKKLPETEDITLENKEAIASLRAMYNDMTDFEKDYIDKESLERLEAAEEKIKELEGTEATN